MKTIRLVLLLTAVCGYVNAYNCINHDDCEDEKQCLPGCETNTESPSCNGNDCASSSKDCVWQCQESNSPIAEDTTVCKIDGSATCGTGTCEAVCATPQVCPNTCTGSDVCSMICQDPSITTTTTDPATTCTTTATAPKSGSPRMELFTPLLVLGTLTKMCFSPR